MSKPRGGTPADPPAGAADGGVLRIHAERCRAFAFELDGVVVDAVPGGAASGVPGTVALLRRLCAAGIRTAAVSASRDAGQVLAAAGVADLFEARVDGADAERLGLADRPDPAAFFEVARRLGVDPADCAVVERASAAMPTDRREGFGLVVHVDRGRAAGTPAQHGRLVIAADLGEIRFALTEAHCQLCAAPPSGPWMLTYRDGDPATEGIREALLTLGNGYFATRGAAPEDWADGTHYPGTYSAGFYNRLVSDVGGHLREDESMVNLPNWLPLTFRPAGGAWFGPTLTGPVHEHIALDLRRGVLHREVLVLDDEGRRTRMRERRLVSMSVPHRGALNVTLIPENWSGRLELRTALDGHVTNGNVAEFAGLANRHLEIADAGTDGQETVWLVAQTVTSKLRVAEAARTGVRCAIVQHGSQRRPVAEPDVVGQEIAVDVDQGRPVTVDKSAALFTSRDRAIFEPLAAARQAVADAGAFDEELAPHAAAWEELWRRFQIQLEDGDDVKLSVNTYLFHLLQTISPHTAELDAGVPARGLHGEAYRGHVFWDELFVFPFLNYRMPELTRALLRYRYRRLPEARRRATALGMRGALFPWQSGSDGREETPTRSFDPVSGRWLIDNSSRQYHVNLAVAYSVWHYWQTTADLGLMIGYGAEMIIETARFWASLATYNPVADRYDIRGVIGPDEFHDGYPDRPGQGIDNSAYINIMVAWTLARARDTRRLLGVHHGDALCRRLGLTDAELDSWEHIGRRLTVPFLKNGIIEQFEGHNRLAELDLDAYRARYGDLRRLGFILDAQHDSTNRYQVSKQADVLMLLYLFTAEELTALIRHLGYDFDPATIPATVDHYLARTAEASTLSRIAHSWVLSRSNRRRSWRMLRDALAADTETKGSTSREGIHLGAMAGTLDILQRCYTGLETRDNILWLNPLLPDELRRLDFDIRYRGQWLSLHFDHFNLSIESHPGDAPPATVAIRDTFHQLSPGGTISCPTPVARHAAQPA